MYRCDKHGKLESEWCDKCQKLFGCDCSDQVGTRFKDLMYDSKNGERTITIWLCHCATCGDPSHVEM